MKTNKNRAARLLLVLLTGAWQLTTAFAQGTAFTYQGRLNDAGGPATGLYDLTFTLYTDPTNGYAVGWGTVTNAATPVTNGLFTVNLDFGYGVFDGTGRWLEIAVQPAGGPGFTTLAPRQALTATPYAQYAAKAGSAITANVANQATFTMNAMNASHANTAYSASTVPASGITGTLDPSQLPAGLLTNGAAGVSLAGAFAGDGSGLTNLALPATALAGTLPDGSLSTNIARLNATNQTFTGTNTFAGVVIATNANNLINGTFIGTVASSQLPAGILTNNASDVHINGTFVGQSFGSFVGEGSGLYNLNAAQLTSGTVPDARLAGNVARLTATNQTYTGTNTFAGVVIATNANNVIAGNFTGSGTGLTQLNGGVLTTGSVGNGALAAASVTADKLAAGQVVKSVNGLQDAVTLTAGANIALATNGNSLQISAAGAAAPWSLTGNSGTSPTNGNFLGTTDNQPLELRVNNQRALRLEPVVGYRNDLYSYFSYRGVFNEIGGSSSNVIATGVFGSVIAGGGASSVINTYGYPPYYTNIGEINIIGANLSFLGGGSGNSIQMDADYSFLGGGHNNSIQTNAYESFLGGGRDNSIQTNAIGSFLGGGDYNSIQPGAHNSFLGGGYANSIQTNAYESFLGGGSGNSIQLGANNSFLGGGYANSIQTNAHESFLGGGSGNSIQTYAVQSFLGGGRGNSIQLGAEESFLGGGEYNYIGSSADHCTLGGGYLNSIQTNASYCVLGGGFQNMAAGPGAVVSGGGVGGYNSYYYWELAALGNQASGMSAAVPGGAGNLAAGDFSFAAGHRAKANFAGDFVWADAQDWDFNSTATNQFSVRAAGGVQFVTSGAGVTIDGSPVLTGSGNQTITGNNNFAGNLGINTASTPEGNFSVNTNIYLFSHTLYLRGDTGVDHNHGLAYNGNTVTNFGTGQYQVDGPALWGFSGGLLGTKSSGDNATLTWNNAGVTVNGTLTAGSFAGNGGGLTNLTVPVAALSGTLADAQLSANIARLNAGQTFTGNQAVVGNLVVSFGSGALTVTNDGGVPGLMAGGTTAPGHLRFRNGLEIFPNFARTASGYLDVRDTNGAVTVSVDGQTGNISSSGNVSADSFNGALIGGTGNTTPAGDPLSVISGGLNNTIQTGASKSVIGGGEQNLIQTNSDHAAIGGGWLNYIGQNNYEAVIAGGYQNGISNNAAYSFIGGGYGNFILQNSGECFLGGGGGNFIQASSDHSVLGGGLGNTIQTNASGSVLGGGANNTNSAIFSVVPGGRGNNAGGQYSFAAGYHAKATNNGTFVWSDGTGTITTSTADNQFVARASGGVVLYSSTGSSGVSLAAGSGTWSSMSDRNAKEKFQQVNPQTVLARVSALPLSTWSYKTEPGVQHIGPMAQDFYAAFAVGPDDKHITTVDESGVALAAIQGLNEKLAAKDAEIRELRQNLAELKQMVQTLAGKK